MAGEQGAGVKIRGFTVFCTPDTPPARFDALLREADQRLPLPVQARRLALPAFPDWLADDADLEALLAPWRDAGFAFIALGPVQAGHDARHIARIPGLLRGNPQAFAGVAIADTRGNIDVERCWRLAEVVRELADHDSDGFGNMYLTALANCPAGSPYFPVAHHAGGPPRFAIAMQAADLAVQACAAASDPLDAQARLREAVEASAGEIGAICQGLADAHDMVFEGIDFSLAPFPGEADSIGAAIESLTGGHVGDMGTVFATGVLASAVQSADFPRCGFSGVMLPVLEDSVLGERSRLGQLGITDLLVASAVCGTGLDTIPLAGDVSVDQLAAIYLDVAMLACRLGKPLTARLMPVPGAVPGDAVHFGSEYFAAGAVMPVPGSGMRRPAAGTRVQVPRLGH